MNPPDKLEDRLLEYGARIIELAESLPRTLVGRHIADQLLRSGTSAGANYAEARGARSRGDFVHRVQIAVKDLRECNYWLRLLLRSDLVPRGRVVPLVEESNQLAALLPKAVAPVRGKAGKETP